MFKSLHWGGGHPKKSYKSQIARDWWSEGIPPLPLPATPLRKEAATFREREEEPEDTSPWGKEEGKHSD